MPKKTLTQKELIKRTLILLGIITLALLAILILLPSREELGPREVSSSPPVYTGVPKATRAPAMTGVPEPSRSPVEKSPPPVQARMAIVIDDAGSSLNQLEPFLSFSGDLTIAVIPGLAHSSGAGEEIFRKGKEVILHLPMEPLGDANPGDGAILVNQDDETIRGLVRKHIASVPRIVGVNNHMGSRATADERVMDLVMETLKGKGLFFLDSRTNSASVVQAAATKYDVPFDSRNVFLDNEPDRRNIKKYLELGIDLALKRGYSIAIGHVQHPLVVEVLKEMLPYIREKGVELVKLSELID